MAKIFSRLYPGDVVQTVGRYAFRKLQQKAADLAMDVFFDFKTVGNNVADYATSFTLANQGTDANISFASCFPYSSSKVNPTLETVEGEGLKTYCSYSAGHSYFKTAGFNVVGLDEAFMRGKKTIFFKITEAGVHSNRYLQFVAPNEGENAMVGLGPAANGYPYKNVFIAEIYGGSANEATPVSESGTYVTTTGVVGVPAPVASDSYFNDLDVIITVGSADEPSPAKIYIGGELVGVFDNTNYCDLYSSDGKLRCFTSTKKYSSSQDFTSYTIPYFGMIRGELSAGEVASLSAKLSEIA